MNLKDAILSTITEIQNHEEPDISTTIKPESFKINEIPKAYETPRNEISQVQSNSDVIEDQFLKDLRERILVLFEGFQSPNNANIEAKVDLTLNFLEHLLAKIDKKLEEK
jgi:hypothetical protein